MTLEIITASEASRLVQKGVARVGQLGADESGYVAVTEGNKLLIYAKQEAVYKFKDYLILKNNGKQRT